MRWMQNAPDRKRRKRLSARASAGSFCFAWLSYGSGGLGLVWGVAMTKD